MSYIHDFMPFLSPQRVCSGAGTWATVRIKKDYTEAFTQRGIYKEQLLHRHFCTQKLLHTEAFTHRSFCTHTPYKKKLLDTDTFNSLFTRKLLHKLLHRDAFRNRSFYTQKLLLREAFKQSSFYTHTHRSFYTEKIWMKWSGQRTYHDPPDNAMPQRLGTVPHTEPINTKRIYQAAITQRCPTRNQNQGTACTAPSTCTVHVNLDAGVTGEFSTSSCKWSSQHHCTRSSPHREAFSQTKGFYIQQLSHR